MARRYLVDFNVQNAFPLESGFEFGAGVSGSRRTDGPAWDHGLYSWFSAVSLSFTIPIYPIGRRSGNLR
jgi:hypothetical protein